MPLGSGEASKMQYRFNEFVLDTDCFELSKNGEPLAAEPQVIELLILLASNAGRLVSKDEINEKVWQGRFVSDAALSSRIKSARQLLGDDGHNQRFIKTVHGMGFRFVADVAAPQNSANTATATLTEKPDRITREIEKPAVVILPFKNLSSDPEQEYFSDGVTADLITHLSKHRWLDVTAQNTAFGYKDKTINLRKLGKELDVSYIVEGSIQRAGNTVRVSVHLLEAATGHHKWAQKFDRQLADIFALQDEITTKIAARLEPEIGYAERNRVVHSRPANLQTWDCYHLGMYHFFQFTAADNIEAQRLFLQCQKMDSQFGGAYAWWAYAVMLGMVYWDTDPTQALLDEALEATDKALSLDPPNAVFHALKARVLLARKEYDRAMQVNLNAIELNPTLASAYCGMGDSLAYEGRYDEAMDYFQQAIDLSPNDPQLWAFCSYRSLALIFKKDFEAALMWADRACNIPNYQFWTIAHKLVSYAYLGDEKNMKVTRDMLLKDCPGFTCAFARAKLFYVKDPAQVDLYIEGLKRAGVLQT